MENIPIKVLRKIFDYFREDESFQWAEEMMETLCEYHYLEDKEDIGAYEYIEERKRFCYGWTTREISVLDLLDEYWSALESKSLKDQ